MDLPYTLVPYFSTKEEAHCTPWLDDPAYLLQSCTLKYLIITIFRVIFENSIIKHLQCVQNSNVGESCVSGGPPVSRIENKVKICSLGSLIRQL